MDEQLYEIWHISWYGSKRKSLTHPGKYTLEQANKILEEECSADYVKKKC